MLEEVSPSLVFFTHQRPPQGFSLALAARELGITTVAFIFSWDNLSSKGRVPVVFDHYLVWSNHMKRELLHFYPDVRPQNVHVVGTPQFEPYVHDEYGWSEAELCRRTGMRPECKRICFSAGDASTSPNDVHYLRTMAEMRRAGAFGDGVEIVVRPSPAEDGDRFNGVREEFPELVWCPPRWRQTRSDHPEPWSQRLPEADDIDLLKSLTVHCDVNVNMASTMTLDFGLAGKPVVNLAFGGEGGAPELFDDFSYYRFEHYRPVIALGAARLARSPDELAEHVRAYLRDPDLDAEGRTALVDMQVDVPLRGTSERIVDALSRIAEEPV